MIYIIVIDSMDEDNISMCTTNKELALNSICQNKKNFRYIECWDNNVMVFLYGLDSYNAVNKNRDSFNFVDLLIDITQESQKVGIQLD